MLFEKSFYGISNTAWTPISLCLILLKYTRLARIYFWYLPPDGLVEHLCSCAPFLVQLLSRSASSTFQKSRKLHLDTGWQEHESSFALALLIALKHSKPCSVGKVAFEVTFSLWRLLKGHLGEVSCLFLWEFFSNRGEHLWRCRQQRLPRHPPSQKAGAAVVVAAKTEKTLQAYWENVTCAKENPLAKSEWKHSFISGIIELLHDIWDSLK